MKNKVAISLIVILSVCVIILTGGMIYLLNGGSKIKLDFMFGNRNMILVDNYNGDDELSMQDNNSSCFNYRIVENIDRLSWHAFGLAVDINPLYNPYVANGKIYPKEASSYVDRDKSFVGKIDHDDLAYKIFTKYGWKWGGDFEYVKDYQHFYKEILDDKIRERID